ncbi:MAG: hypothetical protein AABX12_00165 [Nanoarchaeota archaeon]
MKANILFICKYNRFRSRIAEDYFNQINTNKKIKTKSAGIIQGSPVNQAERKICRAMHIDISGKPQGLSSNLLKWQDITVIVANDVPPAIFKNNKKYGKKLLVWEIPDNKGDTKKEIEQIVESIKRKVEVLVKNLS